MHHCGRCMDFRRYGVIGLLHLMRPLPATLLWPWLLLMVIIATMSALIPPMQSPDETSHIGRAFSLSRGEWLLQPIPMQFEDEKFGPESRATIERARQLGGRMGAMVDQGLLEFADLHLQLVLHPEHRFTSEEQGQIADLKWTGQSRYFFMPGAGYYFPAIYLPQAFGLGVGQLLDLKVMHSYYLARATTWVICGALLFSAFRLLTPGPLAMALLLLPMSLFQLASPTIDGLSLSLSLLAISRFVHAVQPGNQHTAAAAWRLAFGLFVLVSCRTQLLPMLLMPFYLAWQRRSRPDLIAGSLMAVATVCWIGFALHTTSDPRVIRTDSTGGLLVHYASHPLAFVQIVRASLADHDMFTFYQQSFIGILGWLGTKLSLHFYPLLWGGLAGCSLIGLLNAAPQANADSRLFLVFLGLASALLVFLALLLTWTPHPATVIQGVQGRYFTVPALLLATAVGRFSLHARRLGRWFEGFAIGGFALISLTALTTTLLHRYH